MEHGKIEERRVKPPPSQPENHQQPPPPPPQKCPRCDSPNTKFCYYNNYSLSQPRYFCKTCRRYWTQGGTLRNVPVGGGCRKAKRAKTSSSSNNSSSSLNNNDTSSRPPHHHLPPPAHQPPLSMHHHPISMTSSPYYSGGGGFLSSLAAMNSLAQTQPPNLSGFSVFQGFNDNLPLQHQNQQQPIEFYQMGSTAAQSNNLVQPNRPLTYWNQNLINNNNGSTSSPNPNAGASLNSHHMPDFPGYGHSSA